MIVYQCHYLLLVLVVFTQYYSVDLFIEKVVYWWVTFGLDWTVVLIADCQDICAHSRPPLNMK